MLFWIFLEIKFEFIMWYIVGKITRSMGANFGYQSLQILSSESQCHPNWIDLIGFKLNYASQFHRHRERETIPRRRSFMWEYLILEVPRRQFKKSIEL